MKLEATSMLKYGFRICRMLDLYIGRTLDWSNFRLALRPDQVAVVTRGGGMVFCDADTERIAFGAD